MKVVTIGGGSTYTPELMQGFLEGYEKLGLEELVLVDIDRERLEVVGGFAQRMVMEASQPFRLLLETDLEKAIQDADVVTTQIRVGQMPARKQDELLGKRWDLVGQETTGVGGMAKALRTVPVVLDLAQKMKRLCPHAWLINFANPSGLITEALQRYAPEIRSVGLCNSPLGYQMEVAKEIELDDPFQVELDYIGLNHLAWIWGARLGEQDLWETTFQRALQEAEKEEDPPVSAKIMRRLGAICTYYLRYYYRTQSVLEKQRKDGPTRADEVMAIEKKLLSQYADPDLTAMPPELMERGGAYYSTAAIRLMESIVLDKKETHIVNTRHDGAVPGLPKDWVMEIPCVIDSNGAHPLPTKPLPLFAEGLLRTVKGVELLIAEAAQTGNRDAVLQALIAHPLGPDSDVAEEFLEDMLAVNKKYLLLFHES